MAEWRAEAESEVVKASNVCATILAQHAKELEETVGQLSLDDIGKAVSDMEREFDAALYSLGITPERSAEGEAARQTPTDVSHENAA